MQFEDTPLGMLQDMLSLPSASRHAVPTGAANGSTRTGAAMRQRLGASLAAQGELSGGMAVAGHGDADAAYLAALPAWCCPSFVDRHNKAVKRCLQDAGVKV